MSEGPVPRSVDEHRETILADLIPAPPVTRPLAESLGLGTAEDLTAPMPLPAFDNSAMDGYAVRRADVASASSASPVELPVVGEIGAGSGHRVTVPAGTAAKIMTGAPIPPGADAVVPYEWTDRGVDRVRIDRVPGEGQHVRAAGEDITVGDPLVAAGTTLGPRQLGLLAAVGVAEVRVRPRPRVVILSTGSELREPGTELDRDSIYDGNSFLLAAAVERAGGVARRVGIVPDSPEAFWKALTAELDDADLVITSGGVSAGDFDVVKEALAPRGVWFGPVAMQPGKPQGYGRVADSRDRHGAGIPILTLPGNPVSSYVSFEMFVLPALRRLMGRIPEARPGRPARLAAPVTSPAGKEQFLRGVVHAEPDGLHVSQVGGPGSHLLAALGRANCLVRIPADATALEAGDQVQVLVLEEEF